MSELAQLPTELDSVEAWRLRELMRAGYAYEDAEQIAGRHDIDLHRAIDLVGRGCPPLTATRILL